MAGGITSYLQDMGILGVQMMRSRIRIRIDLAEKSWDPGQPWKKCTASTPSAASLVSAGVVSIFATLA